MARGSKLITLIMTETHIRGTITRKRAIEMGTAFHANPERTLWVLSNLRAKGLLRRIGPDEYGLP